MQLHANAALSLNGRRKMVLSVCAGECSVARAAEKFDVSAKTCRKWCRRYLAEGEAGLADHSSAPSSSPNRTDEARVAAIAALRRLRFTGPEIAETLQMALSTVSGILTRIGMGKLGRMGLEPAQRYEWALPGELVHIDVKKLGRIQGGAGKRIRGGKRPNYNSRFLDLEGKRRNTVGWDYVHIAIDDCTRLAYAEVLGDEKASTVIAFLRRAVAFFAGYGITVQRLLTDNGGAYRSTIHAIACRALGIRHLRTRPYRPQTNGKAERFIRTMLGGWAYGAIYGSSQERTAALDGWLWHYNHRRRHSALGHKPPIARLTERNNLLGTYT
jgi:transposase InsO family protein/transposase